MPNVQMIIGYRKNGSPIRLIRGGSEPVVDPPKNDPPTYSPPASQEELDRIIGARLARERERFADYDDVKARAAQFDALEEQNKTELQREKERADNAERLAQEANVKALRADVALDKGIPANLLSGSTKEELEASAEALLAFRGAQTKQPIPGFAPGGVVTKEKSVSAGAQMFADRKK
jgi:hypothetical protein